MKFLQKGSDTIQLPKDTYLVICVFEIKRMKKRSIKYAMMLGRMGDWEAAKASSRTSDNLVCYSEATAKLYFTSYAEKRRRFEITIAKLETL